jgi:hypothetical protein
MREMLNCFDSSCPNKCFCFPKGKYCVCTPTEIALHAYAEAYVMPPMTSEQREECLEEIAMVEGYDRKEYETATDAQLARGVLCSWIDYCRDKGLL